MTGIVSTRLQLQGLVARWQAAWCRLQGERAMDQAERFLKHRIQEELLWQRVHTDPHATETDALAYLRSQCGFDQGGCRYATSDYCVLDCPFRPERLR